MISLNRVNYFILFLFSLTIPISYALDSNQFPFLVSIRAYNSSLKTFEHICGGSIIADKWILTSKDCLQNSTKSNIFVFAGLNGTFDGEGLFNAQIYLVKQLIRRSVFGGSQLAGDIALIETTTKITFNDKVKRIQLFSGEIEAIRTQNFATTYNVI